MRLDHVLILGICWSVLVVACGPAAAPAPSVVPATVTAAALPTVAASPAAVASPTKEPRPLNMIKFQSPALAQNLIGESPERTLTIYLPPSYFTSSQRYPVVYYLPGFGDIDIIGFMLPDDMNALVAQTKVSEMILVVAPGTNRAGGSFYVNSPVTGNWEDYIAQDVVGYVDSHYRTIPQPQSRGLTGHSMGGFGALYLGMRHPETFGAVYSLSPGLFDQNGLADSQMFSNPLVIDAFVKAQSDILAGPADQAKQSVFYKLDQFTLAYGLAFAPDPTRLPFLFDYPYANADGQLKRDDAVWQRWQAGYGGIVAGLQANAANLKQLRGLVVDYGRQDQYAWIPNGCQYLDAQLTAAGIPHKLAAFDGGHQDQLGARIAGEMLPFFSQVLEAE